MSFRENDPFTVIPFNYKTAIPPPSWYGKPVPPANERAPRQRNAWIIFLAHEYAERKARKAPEKLASELSKEISIKWHSMSDEQRQPYNEAAAWEDEAHRRRWPEYKYHPNSKGRKMQDAGRLAERAERLAEKQVKMAERQVETAQMQMKKAQRQAEQAQRQAEEAQRQVEEVRRRGNTARRAQSGNGIVGRSSREPTTLIQQQHASFGHPQARSSRRTEKTSRREDGHRVEGAPSGNSTGQAFLDTSLLIQQPTTSGYSQGSSSYFRATDAAQDVRPGTIVGQDFFDPAFLFQQPPTNYGHSQGSRLSHFSTMEEVQRARSGNITGQSFPELSLTFQQQPSNFVYSQGSSLHYPMAEEAQSVQSGDIAGQNFLDPALLFQQPPPSYGHSQRSSSYFRTA